MEPDRDNERELLDSWHANAGAWTAAVREGKIASRKAGTNAALLSCIRRVPAGRILDVGCGEGWLARELGGDGYDVVGIDASPELIAEAAKGGGGTFIVMSYEELASNPDALGPPFQMIVCNFSLLGESLTPLLTALRALLAPDGIVVIQTLHPCGAAEERYEPRWCREDFQALGGGFAKPMPYYRRTFGAWLQQLGEAGLRCVGCDEPLHPDTGRPLSLILLCE